MLCMIWENIERRYGVLTKAERTILRSRYPQLSAEEIKQFIPQKGKIVDLGCGRGELINYLDITSNERTFLGIDLSKGKIEMANRTIPVFRTENALECTENANCFIAIQLFYLLAYEDQEELVKRCYDNLKPGGVFIIGVLPKKIRTYVIHTFFKIPLPRRLQFLRTKFFGERSGGPYFRKDWETFLSSIFDAVERLPVKKVDGGCACFYICTKAIV
jgi:SAM-dependent methyltransferase